MLAKLPIFSIASHIWGIPPHMLENVGVGGGDQVFWKSTPVNISRAGSRMHTNELRFDYAHMMLIMCTTQFRCIICCTLSEPCRQVLKVALH